MPAPVVRDELPASAPVIAPAPARAPAAVIVNEKPPVKPRPPVAKAPAPKPSKPVVKSAPARKPEPPKPAPRKSAPADTKAKPARPAARQVLEIPAPDDDAPEPLDTDDAEPGDVIRWPEDSDEAAPAEPAVRIEEPAADDATGDMAAPDTGEPGGATQKPGGAEPSDATEKPGVAEPAVVIEKPTTPELPVVIDAPASNAPPGAGGQPSAVTDAPAPVIDAPASADDAPASTDSPAAIDAPAAPERIPGQPVPPTPAPAALVAGVTRSFSQVQVPAAGTVLSKENMAQWKHLFPPSMAWVLQRGARLPIVETTPMPMEPLRAQATQQYHAQVKLNDQKTDMVNYVAGIPFPFTGPEDPDAAVKLIYNQSARVIVDDANLRNFGCQTGTLHAERGVQLERDYMVGHFRRIYYVSRFHTPPMPTWKTPEGVRSRELLHPVVEPFDLKGSGYTYNRYLDPSRQDDSWIYYPVSRRVRRLSTAQRSEGLFGQDIDLDSYGGFAGNPAWSTWRLLGVKTILGSVHAQNLPPKWQAPPADFAFDDVWEPREVYVIEGISKLPEYAFSRRIIYLDREGWMIVHSDIYDLHGSLWKATLIATKFGKKARPESKISYDYEQYYIPAFSLVDMQLDRMTRCEFPSNRVPNEEGFYINAGDSEGTTDDVFSVSRLIEEGR